MKVTVNLRDEEYKRIAEISEKTGLSKTEVIRKSVMNGGFNVLDETSVRPVLEGTSQMITDMKKLSTQMRQLSAGGLSDAEAERIIRASDALLDKAEAVKSAVRKTVFRRQAWLLHDEKE